MTLGDTEEDEGGSGTSAVGESNGEIASPLDTRRMRAEENGERMARVYVRCCASFSSWDGTACMMFAGFSER